MLRAGDNAHRTILHHCCTQPLIPHPLTRAVLLRLSLYTVTTRSLSLPRIIACSFLA